MVNKKNILVTGSNGQLGSSIKAIAVNYNFNFLFREKNELDITNFSLVKNFLYENKINTIINCAAYTDVNNAKKNKNLSNQINNVAVDNIAKLCSELNIQLIHISTDYVFDGLKKIPYNELDLTNPQNYYGKTKLNGETQILKYKLTNSAIIRTSWLYSKHDNNFVSKILKNFKNEQQISVVDNEIGSPTNANDLAFAIMQIILKLLNSKTEIYHFSNLGFCSRYEFANKINEYFKGDCKIIASKETFSKIKRPKFSALDSSKIIDNFQLKIDAWETSLKKFMINNNNFNK